jgi:hypothetical protein
VGTELTVTPSTGVSAGDTVTVSGTGMYPNAPVWLGGCTAEILTAPAELDEHCHFLVFTREMREDGEFTLTDDAGTFSTEVVVGAPSWEAIVVFRPWESDYTVEAGTPLAVTPPAGPEVVASADRDEVIAGMPPQVTGWAWPVPEEEYGVRALPCTSVPAPVDDRVAVEAACGPLAGGTPLQTYRDGSFSSWVTVEPGTVALWVGREVGGTPVGAVVPVSVVPTPPAGTLSVTPTTGLADQQVLRATGTGWARSMGPVEVSVCAAGAAPGEPCNSVSALTDTRQDGTFAADVHAPIEFTDPAGGPDTVRCDSAPGACVLVASPWAAPAVRSAPVPLEFAYVPPVVPVVLPLAVTVVEGDTGPTTADVPVVLSQPTRVPVTVAYQTFDAPALGWVATSGADYTPTSGTLTFAPGQTQATIPVAVHGDTSVEGGEMALVAVTDPVGATVGGFSGIGGASITDDD